MSWCDIKNMKSWCEEEIIDYFDRHPDLQLQEYAKKLGISLHYLKQVLMT